MKTSNLSTAILTVLVLLAANFCPGKDGTYTSLDEALKNPEKVEALDLSGKDLEELPGDISKFVNLKSLNLCSNEIEIVSPLIGKLKKLETLNLTRNPLRCLPVEVKGLTELKSLSYKPVFDPAEVNPKAIHAGRGHARNRWLVQMEMQRLQAQRAAINPHWHAGGAGIAQKVDDPMLVTLSTPEECEMFRNQIPEIACGVTFEMRQNMISVSLDQASASNKDLVLHLQKADSTEAGTLRVKSLIMNKGKHELVAWCRLKSNPFFYKEIQRQTFEADGNLEEIITTLVAQLGAESFRERRRAQQELISYGDAVSPYVEKARGHRDPEISMRATGILQALTEGDLN